MLSESSRKIALTTIIGLLLMLVVSGCMNIGKGEKPGAPLFSNPFRDNSDMVPIKGGAAEIEVIEKGEGHKKTTIKIKQPQNTAENATISLSDGTIVTVSSSTKSLGKGNGTSRNMFAAMHAWQLTAIGLVGGGVLMIGASLFIPFIKLPRRMGIYLIFSGLIISGIALYLPAYPWQMGLILAALTAYALVEYYIGLFTVPGSWHVRGSYRGRMHQAATYGRRVRRRFKNPFRRRSRNRNNSNRRGGGGGPTGAPNNPKPGRK